MAELIIFLIFSFAITWISIPSLRRPYSHGFFRFFSWEIILGMILINIQDWFKDPFVWHQVIAWLLLTVSLIVIITGVINLRTLGKPTDQLEATTRLVTEGIYRFIRHPMYASLLYLAWGIFFKSPSILDGCMAGVSTAFLYATARADEAECVQKFGHEYTDYLKKTKMFIPLIF